ncbi:DUF4041 domain-containing protein [Nocardia otitidiscaviarum]|uniref:DUF4041 domain-containing protein n=1 Tax=Nocardia otitidiscaviarum TaxID=1823 RepID=A0A516NKV7_9NOCA|nr:DUF4041 domain-containing protein [Nocardia otitidiscaviarum]MCP9618831.1 DUF4041 domain-containing protein [Nocardia otitidiscaviarum]QDP79515.1 DUF4041 domain-containing protein [Nocardia otitidiscaviarum]
MNDPQAAIVALRKMLIVKERESAELHDRVDELTAQLQALRTSPVAPPTDALLVTVDDALVLQEVGIYEYHHPLENADSYKQALAELRADVREAVKAGDAIVVAKKFSFNNSLAEGRRLTADLSKLMLRAYNAEAENCVRTIRAGNLETAARRLDKAAKDIEKLGAAMQMHISAAYHTLRIKELELTADYMMKVQEEREAAREERERLREQRKVEQELAAERERLEKEQAHYQAVLQRLETTGQDTRDIEDQLTRIADAIAQNDYRAANIRAGYVYVISNIGAFGPNVVKIGLTRRLEPLDRVRELGGASVPFPFDVHAVYFSDDAVTLENELHKEFAAVRLNHANVRREFFFASPEEVRRVLAKKVGNLLDYNDSPEATQYFQSRRYWPTVKSEAGRDPARPR